MVQKPPILVNTSREESVPDVLLYGLELCSLKNWELSRQLVFENIQNQASLAMAYGVFQSLPAQAFYSLNAHAYCA